MSSSLARFRIGEGEVLLLATVQGLVSERDRAYAALKVERPDVVAIAQSPESVATLLRYEPAEDEDLFEDLPDHDYVYSLRLREFGDVSLPAPDLLAAVRWAQDEGVPVFGVDMPEEAYEDLFTKEVSTWGFLRYGRIQRRLAKRPPKAKDPLSFTLAWDATIRKVKGIARVEAERERVIARNAAALAREKGAKVLLIVEAARQAGVGQHLKDAA
ncbi:MAG TPA: hypothetical protein VM582_01675 [Candidatus Thermoplasmatota archaeon]|nr:hypothetical protein [Candidatus Thermoplasmatota archaeon]